MPPKRKAAVKDTPSDETIEKPQKRQTKKSKTESVESDEVEKAPRSKRTKKSGSEEPKNDEIVEKKTRGRKPKTAEIKEELDEPKTAKPRRNNAKVTKYAEESDGDDEPEVKPKKSRKKVEKSDEKSEKVALNVTDTNWEDIDFNCTKLNSKEKPHNLKITSWNVDGLRAWVKKGGHQIFKYDSPDILCLQETKCSKDQLPEEISSIEGYHSYWAESDKGGYAGVGLISRKMPLEVKFGIGEESHDSEGRCITAEYPQFYLVCVYVPNAGRKLVTLPKRLEWNTLFKKYILDLNSKKPVIICGDMNVAHTEIDLANPKTNTKNAGFTKEEREGMSDFLESGFIDVYRKFYPDKKGAYTFWTYMMRARAKNVGWRLDYFLLPERIADQVNDCVIQDKVFGSDHCPLTLFVNI